MGYRVGPFWPWGWGVRGLGEAGSCHSWLVLGVGGGGRVLVGLCVVVTRGSQLDWNRTIEMISMFIDVR